MKFFIVLLVAIVQVNCQSYTTTYTTQTSSSPQSWTTSFDNIQLEAPKQLNLEEIKNKMEKLNVINKEIERTQKAVTDRVKEFEGKNARAVEDIQKKLSQAQSKWDVEEVKSAIKRTQMDFQDGDLWNRMDLDKLKAMNVEKELNSVFGFIGSFY